MKLRKGATRANRRGVVVVVSILFVVVFAALAVSIATLSGANVQLASNQHNANCARACAESGLDVIRFWLNRISISGTTAPGDRFNQIAGSLQNELTTNDITNMSTSYDGSTITIPSVTLDPAKAQSFTATITQIDADTLQVDVTGMQGLWARTIQVNFRFGTRANTVFDFAMATKGPLSLSGNVELEEINVAVGASVYIESENSSLALSIAGNSQINGDVGIVNPNAYVYLQGSKAGIGGETGQAAIDNHVSFGEPPKEFPTPNPAYFEHYVTNTFDPATDTTTNLILGNIRIPAGTNPTFSGNLTLRGIVFIEPPNIVRFSGNTTVTGIIVGNGDLQDNSGTNQIDFSGNVCSYPVTELPAEEQFAQLANETGTFVMAPGFSVSFGGNFNTLNGSIAANGMRFHGNAGGVINGSIINYSEAETEITGNSDLYFNRSGISNIPAGFSPETILQYDPSSYSEVSLSAPPAS